MLQSMGSQRVGYDCVTEQNRTELKFSFIALSVYGLGKELHSAYLKLRMLLQMALYRVSAFFFLPGWCSVPRKEKKVQCI